MEKIKMQEHLRVLESIADDFRDALSKQQAGNQKTKKQGYTDYDVFVKVARSYFKKNPDLYDLLAADENASAVDELFLDEAKFFNTDLSRAISNLKSLIVSPEPTPAEQAPENKQVIE